MAERSVEAGATEDREPLLAVVRAQLRAVVAFVRSFYAQVDPRTAGIFRIGLGALTAGDVLRHWHEAHWAYSNSGVLTNHFHLFRPDGPYNFSIYHAFSSLEEVHIAFGLSLLCHLALLVGWHSRVFAVLSLLIVTSMDNRIVMVENGGYIVVNLIVGYSIFLPIERRFSVDALLRSYRERKERSFADLGVRHRPAWMSEPLVSLAGLLVILNLAVVYFFNVVNKSGNTWRSGEAVHYVMWLNRMVTGVAVLFRTILPFWATRIASWSVLCVEALIFAFILSPYGRRYTRPFAMILMLGLHTTLGVMMRLGPFSWYLIGWSLLLLTPTQWDDLEAWYRRRAGPRVVELDRASPLAFHLGRLLARLDLLDLLRLEASPADDKHPPLVRVLDDGGRSFTGMDAARQIAQALPAGKYVFPVARVASLGLLDLAIAVAPPRRAGIARLFGLGVGARGRERRDEPWALFAGLRRGGVYLREALLGWFALCAVVQAVQENKSVPPWMKWDQTPAPFHASLAYTRMYQGWGMFAPNPITDDGSITVDAITVDGRHVDPFTGEEPDLDITDSDGLGLGQIQQDYFNRIRLDRNKHYRQGLREWILAYPQRTGRHEDEIVAFDVYWVKALCPKPHHDKPYNNELLAILTYRKPGYRPPPGLPPLPKEPPVVSAEPPKDKDKDKGKDKEKDKERGGK